MVSRKAFTLVELLIVTAIIAIVSSVTAYSLSTFAEKAQQDALRLKVSASVDDFDRAIRDGAIGSYEISFASGALGYVSTSDVADVSASGSLQSFDWTVSSGSFLVSAPASGQWTVRLAQDNKIVRTVTLTASSTSVPFSFDVGRRDSYSASFFYGSEPQDRIVMTYFDRDGPLSADESRLKFVSATAGGGEFPNLTVRSVGRRKTFLVWWSPVESATLHFSRWAKEYLVELRK